MTLTVNQLFTLLWLYLTGEHPHFLSPAALNSAFAGLETWDLVEHNSLYEEWDLTPRGRAHVAQLIKLDPPVQAWINRQGQVIHPEAPIEASK